MSRASPALTANTSPLHTLSEQQQIFVEAVVKGADLGVAARQAGYASPHIQGSRLIKIPRIQAALRFQFARYGQAAQMTRKKVMEGLVESIEMAKIQADPMTMVAGWREIGKMCGYYAPEVKKIDISVTTRRVVDQLEALSDDELLRLVDESGQTIEGDASIVLDKLQERSDEAAEREFGHLPA